ncbi:hypothetical protein RFI_03734 [Reticulomyxa filosa]|uniref:Uncharacterized protein n=1 Tax=Reticulomyxa filosa TaxID=46433 RepID=X6P5J7_RETFI|nr:hypothetical protein RFI_03734 [Reticulomyxa filosa]|eukprot:ETO33373.1 hypothetical protein RFI_03734 [Reticulomyxa filosa]
MGPRAGGGGGTKRKRTFEKRWRRTKRRYEKTKDVDQVLSHNTRSKSTPRGQQQKKRYKTKLKVFKQQETQKNARYYLFFFKKKKRKFANFSFLSPPPISKKKKRLKKVAQPKYTQREADACAGLGRDDQEKKTSVDTKDKIKKYQLIQEKLKRQRLHQAEKIVPLSVEAMQAQREQRFRTTGGVQMISVDQ